MAFLIDLYLSHPIHKNFLCVFTMCNTILTYDLLHSLHAVVFFGVVIHSDGGMGTSDGWGAMIGVESMVLLLLYTYGKSLSREHTENPLTPKPAGKSPNGAA